MSVSAAAAVNVVERGTGIPVLALHGWTPDHRLMLGCLEPVFAVRHGYRRIYPDLPGMGLSPAPPSIASSDDLLDVVQSLVEERIGAEPFLLIGESYGGYLARALAAARPEQVLGLALICSTGVAALDPADRAVPRRQVLRTDPALLDAQTDRRLAEAYEDMAVIQTPETLRRFRDEVMAGLDLADTDAMARIRLRWHLSRDPDDAPPYERPTLILAGRQDHCVGYQDQFALLAHYPRASFAVLDIAGHNLQIEQPTLFNELTFEWLDRVASHP